MKSLKLMVIISFIFFGCASEKNPDVFIEGYSEILKHVSVSADLVCEGKHGQMSESNINLFENGEKEYKNLPKKILTLKYTISYKDSLFYEFKSDNKLNKGASAYFYFFEDQNKFYVNVGMGKVEKKFSNSTKNLLAKKQS